MVRKPFSIRTEIVLNLFVLAVVSILLLSIVVLKITTTNLVRNERQRWVSNLAGLQKSAQQYVSGQRSLELFMQGALPSFERYVLYDADGNVISSRNQPASVSADYTASLQKAYNSSSITELVRGGCQGSLLCFQSVEKIDFFVPLIGKGKLYGVLAVHADFKRLAWSLSQTHKTILIFTVIFSLCLLAFAYFVLSKIIVTPINHMRRVAEAITEGDEEQRVTLRWKDELGKLGQAINKMTEKLVESKSQLGEHLEIEQELNNQLQVAQREVIAGEKLASLGRLAAGIAHEIGNPLGTVMGYLEIIKTSDDEQERKQLLVRLESELQRIHLIIRELLGYARPDSGKFSQVDVGAEIKATLEQAVSPNMLEQMQVSVEVEDNLFALLDPNQFRQVLVNLVFNASYAMKSQQKPAKLAIRAQSVKVGPGGDGEIAVVESGSGDGVLVEVEDSGPGMSKEAQAKVFDAFYTTKEPGEGTGLGLYMSRSIVRAWGGRLSVNSQEGVGCTFSILLQKA